MSIVERNFTPDVSTEAPPESSGIGFKEYNPTQMFFLTRLSYMNRQWGENKIVIAPEDWRMKVLGRAILSTLGDCEREGVGGEAKTLLQPPDTNS